MGNPEHQHFIPKSYLRNFALKTDKKYFVEAKLRSEDSPRKTLISINDICVDKNLYTIPILEEGDKYSLEKFYAQKVDSLFPWIYKRLVDPSVIFINRFERSQIIMATMSLFFRTPKFLNFNERRLDSIINFAIKNKSDKNGNVKFKFGDYDLDFNISNLEEVKTNLKIRNKLDFLQRHLKTWNEFIQFKINAGISVFKITVDINLITSDNPVIMDSVVGNSFNVFDPTNIISLPLDNKHYLSIFPNTESSMIDRIFRSDRDKWFALTTNLEVERSSEDWIIGKPYTITDHLKDQVKYGAHTEENIQDYEDLKEKAQDAIALSEIIDEVGTLAHQRVANKVKELRRKRIFRDDPDLQKLILELARNGFLTV